MENNANMGQKNQKPSDQLSAFEKYQELNPSQVAKLIGVTTNRSVWNYVKKGKLPEPRYLENHRAIWRLGEVLDHTHMQMQTPSESVHGFKGEALARDVHEKSSKLSKLRKRLGLS